MHEIELMLCSIFNVGRDKLYSKKISFSPQGYAQLNKYIKERFWAKPLQYILKETEFMGLNFKLTESVFIPRAETEVLVEKTIEIFKDKKGPLYILDIGTGCGNIAISLAKFLSQSYILAVDISFSALRLAKLNSYLQKVENKIKFLQADILKDLGLNDRILFDAIVSNPPYIASAELNKLSLELLYEPTQALDGGEKGLDFYHHIFNLRSLLKEKGYMVLEIDPLCKKSLEDLLQSRRNLKLSEVKKDYRGYERVMVIRNG